MKLLPGVTPFFEGGPGQEVGKQEELQEDMCRLPVQDLDVHPTPTTCRPESQWDRFEPGPRRGGGRVRGSRRGDRGTGAQSMKSTRGNGVRVRQGVSHPSCLGSGPS